MLLNRLARGRGSRDRRPRRLQLPCARLQSHRRQWPRAMRCRACR